MNSKSKIFDIICLAIFQTFIDQQLEIKKGITAQLELDSKQEGPILVFVRHTYPELRKQKMTGHEGFSSAPFRIIEQETTSVQVQVEAADGTLVPANAVMVKRSKSNKTINMVFDVFSTDKRSKLYKGEAAFEFHCVIGKLFRLWIEGIWKVARFGLCTFG